MEGNVTMSIGHIIGLVTAIATIMGVMVGILIFVVKKSMSSSETMIKSALASHESKDESNDRLKEDAEKRLIETLNALNKNVERLNDEMHNLKLEISANYVRVSVMEDFKIDNKKSHENQWKELRKMKEDFGERIVILETRLSSEHKKSMKEDD